MPLVLIILLDAPFKMLVNETGREVLNISATFGFKDKIWPVAHDNNNIYSCSAHGVTIGRKSNKLT